MDWTKPESEEPIYCLQARRAGARRCMAWTPLPVGGTCETAGGMKARRDSERMFDYFCCMCARADPVHGGPW